MNIREAKAQDCMSISRIYNRYLGKSTMDLEPKEASFYESFLIVKNAREELWVAEIKNIIIGWGVIKLYSPKLGYQYTGETSVYLDSDHLGLRYGTSIKQHLLNRCKALEYHNLLARIFASNNVSIDYNKKLGYRIVGQQKEVGYINGHWQDVVIMELIL
ncbi:MAG: L-amino acid N-acyltransferase YncA [Saprospiraceae bacterium]|jgi:L-amino acid N-acyltransferase YncA